MAAKSPSQTCPLTTKMKEDALTKMLYDTMVIVKVGSKEQEFHVNKDLICHYSEYFRGAFKDGFKESEGIVELDQENPETFRCFFDWLYTGKAFRTQEGMSFKEVNLVFKAYIFAETRGIPLFKNELIDLFIDLFINRRKYPAPLISYVYNNTSENDNLRVLLVEIMAQDGGMNPDHFFKDMDEVVYPYGFIWNVCKAAVGRKNRKKPTMNFEDWAKNKCKYHDHTDINASREPESLSTTSPGDNATPKKE